jgi:hypothetical protein
MGHANRFVPHTLGGTLLIKYFEEARYKNNFAHS